MKIPNVTDEMLEKVVQAAASPVILLLEEAQSEFDRRNRAILEIAADDFDDRIIFIRISIDENPDCVRRFGMLRISTRRPVPGIVAFLNKKKIGCIIDKLELGPLRDFLQSVREKTGQPQPPKFGGDDPIDFGNSYSGSP